MEKGYQLLHGDCLDRIREIEDSSIDLTVTSPPYDDLRTYNGKIEHWNEGKWRQLFRELYRVTKQGGVVVWVVNDATIEGSETGTSFKQALWAKYIGFNLHDTMIYLKDQLAFPDDERYYNAFEYMFVFSKGKPKTFNPIKDKKNKSAGKIVHGTDRQRDGSFRPVSCKGNITKEYGVRWNYWLIYNQKRGLNTLHPAPFPEQLAHDHIISWSNKGDKVFDPLMGGGTTGVAAIKKQRNFIGIDLEKQFCKLAEKRIKKAWRGRGLLNLAEAEQC